MALSSDITSLSKLHCFKDVKHSDFTVSSIKDGLSHTNYKVMFTRGNVVFEYFVKRVSDSDTAELQKELIQEVYKSGLTPKLIFSNKEWLVSEYINGLMLFNSKFSPMSKYQTSVSLMSQFHELEFKTPLKEINLYRVIDNLIQEISLSDKTSDFISTLLANIHINKGTTLVPNHGDVNYKNILISDKQYIIDFETVCLAEAEYDLGMMMAINLIPQSEVVYLTNLYNSEFNNTIKIQPDKVTRYSKLASIINGLWYMSCYRQGKGDIYQKLAKEQFEYADIISDQTYFLSDQMR